MIPSSLKRIFSRGEERVLPPPKLLKLIGSDDVNYGVIGLEFFGYLKDFAALSPGDRVLEVGCGVGRIAQPLRTYLAPPGSYDGFDIMREAIVWCKRNITRNDPHIRFHFADIRNGYYNANGKKTALEYRFPWNDNSFDLVFLTSVFTHIVKNEVDHYLSEIARVLRPGGRCLVTYFLLNDQSRKSLREGTTIFRFDPEATCMTPTSKKTPELALAYDEHYVIELHNKHRLPVKSPIFYGTWSHPPSPVSFQDIVIAVRE